MATSQETGSLGEQIRQLGPWHQDIQLTDEFSTGQVFSPDGKLSREANRNVSLLTLRDNFVEHIRQVYPEGLRGKRFLDCACNAGGYCFWARELGADLAYGFDIRKHWIDQASFVRRHRVVAPTDRIKFAVCDLYALEKKRLPKFDVTLFKGIFYHLPDPITGLRIVSDLTREVLIFNTQTGWGEPDGFLKPGLEDTKALMSGAYGLNWRPTGPATMIPVLKWLGYCTAKLMFFRQQKNNPDGDTGRMEIWATKVPGLLDSLESQRTLFNES
jgi:SAM-dependent methyltransferase